MEAWYDTYRRTSTENGNHHKQFRFALKKSIYNILEQVSTTPFLFELTIQEHVLVRFRNHILDTTNYIRSQLTPYIRSKEYNSFDCFFIMIQLQQDLERLEKGETRTLFLRRSISDRLTNSIAQWTEWMTSG